jgi:hypothetical protein
MKGTRIRSWIVTAALAAGVAVGAAGVASAASGGSSSSGGTPAGLAANGPHQSPAAISHGPGETLLTGATAAKVRAAALKAVPGATVARVETDSGSAAYEAHLRKADGSFVTVKLNRAFAVTATQSGFGGPPPGSAAAPSGGAPTL